MFGLFKNKPLFDESETKWLFDSFAWSLENFDANYFYNHTVLVQPTNQFFPGDGPIFIQFDNQDIR